MEIELWNVNGVQELLGVSRKRAIRILNMKRCPVLPRGKGGHYLVPKNALREWLETEGYRR